MLITEKPDQYEKDLRTVKMIWVILRNPSIAANQIKSKFGFNVPPMKWEEYKRVRDNITNEVYKPIYMELLDEVSRAGYINNIDIKLSKDKVPDEQLHKIVNKYISKLNGAKQDAVEAKVEDEPVENKKPTNLIHSERAVADNSPFGRFKVPKILFLQSLCGTLTSFSQWANNDGRAEEVLHIAFSDFVAFSDRLETPFTKKVKGTMRMQAKVFFDAVEEHGDFNNVDDVVQEVKNIVIGRINREVFPYSKYNGAWSDEFYDQPKLMQIMVDVCKDYDEWFEKYKKTSKEERKGDIIKKCKIYPSPEKAEAKFVNSSACCTNDAELLKFVKECVNKYYYDQPLAIEDVAFTKRPSKQTLGRCWHKVSVAKASHPKVSNFEENIQMIQDDFDYRGEYYRSTLLEINNLLKGCDITETVCHELAHAIVNAQGYSVSEIPGGHGKHFMEIAKLCKGRGGPDFARYSTDEAAVNILNMYEAKKDVLKSIKNGWGTTYLTAHDSYNRYKAKCEKFGQMNLFWDLMDIIYKHSPEDYQIVRNYMDDVITREDVNAYIAVIGRGI